MESTDMEDCERILPDITIDENWSLDDAARVIAESLNEPNEILIRKVVKKLGIQKAVNMYHQVKEAECNGGVLTTDGTRRRTPGGVFFLLINQDSHIESIVKKEIFHDTSKMQHQLKIQAMKEKRWKKNKELKDALLREGLMMLKKPDQTTS